MRFLDRILYVQQLLNVGGSTMYIIAFCSVAALVIVLERILLYHRMRIDVEEFLRGLFNVLKSKNVVEAISICDDTPGPVARVVRAALLHCGEDEAALRRAVDEAIATEVPLLEKRLKMLATIAHITPLLGLLGTVLGMIGAFEAMQAAGPFVSTTDLAMHIRKALVTTAAGLCVGIPAYAFYNYLVGKVEHLALDMERAGNELVYFITHSGLDLESPPVVES